MHPLFKTPISELFPILKMCLKQVGEDGKTIETVEEQNVSSEGLELSDCSSQGNIDKMLEIHEGGLEPEAIEEEKKRPIRIESLEEAPNQQNKINVDSLDVPKHQQSLKEQDLFFGK